MARDRKFPWFRVYSELANERKIVMIARLIGWSKSQTIGAWTIMLCMANDSPERGKLLIAPGVPCTKADIASEIEITPEQYEPLDIELSRLGMIIWNDGVCSITNWNQRQHKSDDPYERVTKFRENEKQAVTSPLQERYNAVDVTFDSVSASVSDSLINNNGFSDYASFQDISARDAEQIYQEITGQPTIPPNQLENTLALLVPIISSYTDKRKLHDDGLGHFTRWCNSRGKNGRNYASTNPGWVSWWYEAIAPSPARPEQVQNEYTGALCGTGQKLKRKAEDLGDRDHEQAVIDFRKHIDTCRICGGKEIESKPIPDEIRAKMRELTGKKVINNET